MEASMSTTGTGGGSEVTRSSLGNVDMNLEVIVLPVSDVDRAKEFYRHLGLTQTLPPATTSVSSSSLPPGRGVRSSSA
jgi:hypothetical protein